MRSKIFNNERIKEELKMIIIASEELVNQDMISFKYPYWRALL